MNALLKVTGIGTLVSFYRYIHLNQPRLTTLACLALVLAVGAVHLVAAPAHFRAAAYLGALFVANFAVTLAAAAGILRGARLGGWTLGAVVCGLSFLAYLVSRIFGLPGLGGAVGEWDEPLGSLALVLEGLFLAGWFSVVTGLAVAAPDRRDWHD